jgi:anti-sigma B factor antagonist
MAGETTFERFDRDGVRTLRLTGEIDLAVRDGFLAQMERLLVEAHSPVCVDLAAVGLLDASGLGVLVAINNRGAEIDVPLILRAPRPIVRRVLEISGLDQLFTIEEP